MSITELSIADLVALIEYSGKLAVFESTGNKIKTALRIKWVVEEELLGRLSDFDEISEKLSKMNGKNL